MADATVQYGGGVDGASGRALQLKLFGGEVLSAFQRRQIFMDKHRVKTLTSGKSY